MKKTATLLLVLLFALTACAPATDESTSSEPSSPNPTSENPISSPMPVEPNPYAPQPSDASLTRGNAFLDSTDLLTLESFPLQFTLHLVGSLPTPCNQLRVTVTTPDSENKIYVDVYSVSNPDEICMQVIKPFEANIPLGSFPEGAYTLWVNGEMVAEFQS